MCTPAPWQNKPSTLSKLYLIFSQLFIYCALSSLKNLLRIQIVRQFHQLRHIISSEREFQLHPIQFFSNLDLHIKIQIKGLSMNTVDAIISVLL